MNFDFWTCPLGIGLGLGLKELDEDLDDNIKEPDEDHDNLKEPDENLDNLKKPEEDLNIKENDEDLDGKFHDIKCFFNPSLRVNCRYRGSP